MSAFLSLALVLMLSWTGLAQSPATSPQQPSAATPQSGAAQGTIPPASQPAPSQAAPQTSTTPGTTPGSAASSAPGTEDNPLNLTEEQKAKLRPILADERQQMETVQNDNSLSMEQKMAKAQQIRETASPKIKALLTPEQLKKLSDMQKTRQQNQSAPAGNTPPQQ
jgi:Spy/CpxP family protein refolding chaperone